MHRIPEPLPGRVAATPTSHPAGSAPLARRTVLGLLGASVVAGCAAPDPPAPTAPTGPPAPAPVLEPIRRIEERFAVTLAVHARDTADGTTLAHRAGERFAFCSMFKLWAATALLARSTLADLERRVPITPEALLASSLVTRERAGSSMSLAEVCDAALRFSDGTAGNVLLREAGGPAGLTAFLREAGDPVSRVDRTEPDLATAVPGDVRDTTTAERFAAFLQTAVLGGALPEDRRAFLVDLLRRNTTGADRIRAGVPGDWVVANRTGTGGHGTVNDAAVLRPPGDGAPVVLVVASRQSTPDDDGRPDAVAAVTREVLGALR